MEQNRRNKAEQNRTEQNRTERNIMELVGIVLDVCCWGWNTTFNFSRCSYCASCHHGCLCCCFSWLS